MSAAVATTMPSPAGFAELAVVKVIRDVPTDDGMMPRGSTGVVVGIYADGKAYEVEFHRPFHTVATLDVADLAA